VSNKKRREREALLTERAKYGETVRNRYFPEETHPLQMLLISEVADRLGLDGSPERPMHSSFSFAIVDFRGTTHPAHINGQPYEPGFQPAILTLVSRPEYNSQTRRELRGSLSDIQFNLDEVLADMEKNCPVGIDPWLVNKMLVREDIKELNRIVVPKSINGTAKKFLASKDYTFDATMRGMAKDGPRDLWTVDVLGKGGKMDIIGIDGLVHPISKFERITNLFNPEYKVFFDFTQPTTLCHNFQEI